MLHLLVQRLGHRGVSVPHWSSVAQSNLNCRDGMQLTFFFKHLSHLLLMVWCQVINRHWGVPRIMCTCVLLFIFFFVLFRSTGCVCSLFTHPGCLSCALNHTGWSHIHWVNGLDLLQLSQHCARVENDVMMALISDRDSYLRPVSTLQADDGFQDVQALWPPWNLCWLKQDPLFCGQGTCPHTALHHHS